MQKIVSHQIDISKICGLNFNAILLCGNANAIRICIKCNSTHIRNYVLVHTRRLDW